MRIDTREIIDAISILTDLRNMRVPLRQAGKGSLICAATAFLGELLLGPEGLVVGGIVGGLTGMAVTKGKFKSVAEIIKENLIKRLYVKIIEASVSIPTFE